MKDFLLEEYKALNESLHINEEIGEKRLTFFITLVTGVLAGIITVMTSFENIPREFVYPIAFLILGTLIAISIIGWIIYRRMKKRNSTTDGIKKDINRIRTIMKLKYNDGHKDYFKFYSAFGGSGTRKFTSLVDIMAILNSFLAGFIVFLILYFSLPPTDEVIVYNVLISLAVIAIIIFSTIRKQKLTHAGGILLKKAGTQNQVLLISSKSSGEWVLPKGHIEERRDYSGKTEDPEETAVREVLEETGYSAEIITHVGDTPRYNNGKESVTVRYFLMSALSDDAAPAEDRKKVWVEISQAVRMVKKADLKRLLSDIALMVD